jgi:hypothetical protein
VRSLLRPDSDKSEHRDYAVRLGTPDGGQAGQGFKNEDLKFQRKSVADCGGEKKQTSPVYSN